MTTSEGRTSRRSFIREAGMLIGGGMASAVTGCATGAAAHGGESVRFCAFADIHYCQNGYWPNGNYEWLDRILRRGTEAKSDFIVSLGDMSFDPVKDRAYIAHYLDYAPTKTYYIYGNHEFGERTFEEIAPVCRVPVGHYHWDCRGFRFIALDPHYRVKDGKVLRFERRCSHPDENGMCFCVPPEQVAWLRETLDASPYPCVVMAHERFDDRHGLVSNHAEIRQAFNDANAKCPGKVRLVINGHHHKNYLRVLDGIPYFDLNSASYDIERDHKAYPEEFRRRCGSAKYILTWNDPLSAIITLTRDGGLRIEGSRSSFYLGVTPEMAKWKGEWGRETQAEVLSADLKFNY